MFDRSVLSGVGRMLTALVLVAAVAPVVAQDLTAPGLDDALRPDYLRRDLQMFSRNLAMDATQRDIAAALFDDYEASFREGVSVLRDALAEQVGTPLYEAVAVEEGERRFTEHLTQVLQDLERESEEASPVDQPEIWIRHGDRISEREHLIGQGVPREPAELRLRAAETAARVEQWRLERAQLAAALERGILGTLTDDQVELWPGVLREMLKTKSLPRGRLSGESLDVRALSRPVLRDAAVTATVEPILAEYDLALDAALARREAWIAEHQYDLALAYVDRDLEATTAILRGENARRAAVRDTNEQFAEAVAAALPEVAAAELRERFRAKAWSRVYRMTRGERVYRSAREQLELDTRTAEALDAAYADYAVLLAGLDEQAVEALRVTEMQERVQRIRKRLGDETPAPVDPARAVFAARTELDRQFAEQVKGLLTDEQIALVPGLRPARAAVGGAVADVDPRSLPTLSQRWNRVIEMFDRDGDGHLGDEERAKALEYLKQPPPTKDGQDG